MSMTKIYWNPINYLLFRIGDENKTKVFFKNITLKQSMYDKTYCYRTPF